MEATPGGMMKSLYYAGALALCLSACACGPHASRDATASATDHATAYVPQKPQGWEITAGARWARPGVWSPVSEKPGSPPVEAMSSDSLGVRIVRPAQTAGSFDVWQARVSCVSGQATIIEGLEIDASGRHVRPLSPSIPKLDAAAVGSFCSPTVHSPGGLTAARDLLKASAKSGASTVAEPNARASAPPRITPEALKRMDAERRQAIAEAHQGS